MNRHRNSRQWKRAPGSLEDFISSASKRRLGVDEVPGLDDVVVFDGEHEFVLSDSVVSERLRAVMFSQCPECERERLRAD